LIAMRSTKPLRDMVLIYCANATYPD